MSRLLLSMSAMSVLLFLIVLISVRRSHIRVEYSMGWLAAAVALFGLSRSSWLLERASQALHFGEPAVILLGCVFGVFLLLFFWASISLSRLRDDTIELVQRLAILEFRQRYLNGFAPRANNGENTRSN